MRGSIRPVKRSPNDRIQAKVDSGKPQILKNNQPNTKNDRKPSNINNNKDPYIMSYRPWTSMGLPETTWGYLGLPRATWAYLGLLPRLSKTAGTCIFFNFTASDQYLAIVVPGRMFSKEFKNRGLKPENLSRTLEDSGTVTSPLIPWNTCGAVHGGVLGITAGSYWMFCFFNLISPIMTMLYGFLNIRIRRYSKEEMQAIKSGEVTPD